MRGCWLVLVLVGWAWSGCAGMLGKGGDGTGRAQVAVLDLDGAGPDDPAQSYVESMVSQRFEVVSADTYWARAKRLGAGKLTKRDVAEVSASLGLTAVIHGKVRPRSKQRGRARRVQTIRLVVRDGPTGAVLERHKVKLHRGEVTAGSDKRMARRFLAKVKEPSPAEPVAPDQPDRAQAAAKGGDDAGKAAAAQTDRDKSKDANKTGDKGKATGEDPAAEEPEEPALPAVEYDDRGQAIDDESPL